LAGALKFAKSANVFFDIRTFNWCDSVQQSDRVGDHCGYILATRGRDGLKAGIRLRIELKGAADNVHWQRIVRGRAGEKGIQCSMGSSTLSGIGMAITPVRLWKTGKTVWHPIYLLADPILPQITGYGNESVSDSRNHHAFLAPIPG
jgi:hypothetical protein